MTLGGVVLAAGASRRARTIKALVELDGEPLVARAIRTLREGGCDEVVVVVGPPHAETIAAAIGDAERVDNPRPEDGMRSSLALGLDDRWDAAVVSLVDHPRVRAETVAALIARWRETRAAVVRPTHAGESGHPFLVARAVFDPLRHEPSPDGARSILRAHAPLDVEVDDPAIHEDLDTAPDLAKLRSTRG